MAALSEVIDYVIDNVVKEASDPIEVSHMCTLIHKYFVRCLPTSYKNVRIIHDAAQVRTLLGAVSTWASPLDKAEIEETMSTANPEVWLAEPNNDSNMRVCHLPQEVIDVISVHSQCCATTALLGLVVASGRVNVVYNGKQVTDVAMMAAPYIGKVTARAPVAVNMATKRVFCVALPLPKIDTPYGKGRPHMLPVLSIGDACVIVDPTIGQFVDGKRFEEVGQMQGSMFVMYSCDYFPLADFGLETDMRKVLRKSSGDLPLRVPV